MKLKIVTVDLELTRRQKRIGVLLGAVAGAALGASVAVAMVPHTFAAGQTLKASDLNEDFKDLDDKLATLQAPVSARYHLKVAQVLPGEAFPALGMPVNYDTKDYDSANAVTTGANWAFTAPVDGKYLLTASLAGNCPTCANAAVFGALRIAINGVWDFEENALDVRYDWTGGNMSLNGSDVLELKANDTVSIRFTENLVGSTFTAGAGAVTFTRVSD